MDRLQRRRRAVQCVLRPLKRRILIATADSDVIYYNVAGQDFVVVNTLEATNELFVKRSSIYSDR